MYHARALDRMSYENINSFTPQKRRDDKPVLRAVVAEAAPLVWAFISSDTQNPMHTDKLPLVSFTRKYVPTERSLVYPSFDASACHA